MVYWLRANKISLNTGKTEINLFRTKKNRNEKTHEFKNKWTENMQV